MTLQWKHWSERTKSMVGLDDVVRYDLSPFGRKMEPAYEAFYRCSAGMQHLNSPL